MEQSQLKYKIREVDYIVNTIIKDDIIFYKAIDISKILCNSNHRSLTRNISKTEKKLFNIKTNGGNQKMAFITSNALKIILIQSRSINACEFASLLDIEINSRLVPFECETIKIIMNVFHGEIMKLQYNVDQYRIDLYFEEYKLAIECDENHHIKYKGFDNVRQKYIENKLECKFIRYFPQSDTFDICKVLNEIFVYIKNYKK